ncbi:hypothetical protein OXX69_004429 [Metschnikowia pulcherrima]
MFPNKPQDFKSSPPAISSPLRKLHRHNAATENVPEMLPSTHTYDKFDTVLGFSPNEILSIQEDQNDYICGVQTNGHVCGKSLYCRYHSLDERNEVQRSVPLGCLIIEESKNREWFRKRRALTKMYYDCKAYWQKHPSASMTPMTCSQTSCVREGSNYYSSPKCVSVTSHNAAGIMVNSEEGAFSSLKRAFLNKLSRAADAHKEDIVSYLFYRLACYEVAGVEVRTRELEARYNASENGLELGQCGGSN